MLPLESIWSCDTIVRIKKICRIDAKVVACAQSCNLNTLFGLFLQFSRLKIPRWYVINLDRSEAVKKYLLEAGFTPYKTFKH